MDIYTEPTDIDVETLRNLGPLSGMAGIFEGTRSLDINPKAQTLTTPGRMTRTRRSSSRGARSHSITAIEAC